MSAMEDLEKIIDKPFTQYERETVERCYLIEFEKHEGHGCFQIKEVMHFIDYFESTIKRRVRGSILLSMNASIVFSKHRTRCTMFIIGQGRSEGDLCWISHLVNCPTVNNIEIFKWEMWQEREFFSMARRKLSQCEGVFASHFMIETNQSVCN